MYTVEKYVADCYPVAISLRPEKPKDKGGHYRVSRSVQFKPSRCLLRMLTLSLIILSPHTLMHDATWF